MRSPRSTPSPSLAAHHVPTCLTTTSARGSDVSVVGRKQVPSLASSFIEGGPSASSQLVLAWSNQFQMARIHATTMRAVISPRARRVIRMASVVGHESISDRTMGRAPRPSVSHDPDTDSVDAVTESPVALNKFAAPWPARIWTTRRIDRCPESIIGRDTLRHVATSVGLLATPPDANNVAGAICVVSHSTGRPV